MRAVRSLSVMRGRLCALVLVVWCSYSPVAAQNVEVTRGPYLQALLADSVKSVWRTDTPIPSRVRFAPTGGEEQVVEMDQLSTEHDILLSGLSPATEYSYEVLEGDRVLAGGDIFRFRTPPQPGNGSFRAVVIGDSGDARRRAQNRVTQLVERLAPDLFLHTDDIMHTDTIDEAVFDEYKTLMARAGLFPTRGNHANLSIAEWTAIFSPPEVNRNVPACALPEAACDAPPQALQLPDPRQGTFYSFDRGPAHFAVLDTQSPSSECSPQLKWLCADLSRAKERGMAWLVLMFHFPVFTTGNHSIIEFDVTRVIPPIADHYGVDLVLSGHDHNYQRSYPLSENTIVDAWQEPSYRSPAGTTYVVTGGGGGILYDEIPGAAHRSLMRVFRDVHHAVQLEFSPDTLTVTALTPEDEILDKFSILKDIPRDAPGFVRGDTNLDGNIDISDAIAELDLLFLGARTPCPGALLIVADGNRSGAVDLADAIFLLNFLFRGGPPPGAPFRDCQAIPNFDDSGRLRSSCRL